MIKFSLREKKIIGKFRQLRKKSPSHNLDHLIRVAEYALKLQEVYGGDRKIIIPACLLHDLGRSKPSLHGKKGAVESAKMAEPILTQAGYSLKEIAVIVRVIAGHDRPNFSPELIEAKILKDADFLDGFGARGILRTVYYTAEAGESLAKALVRLKTKMRQRYEGLEFQLSRQMAQENYLLVRLVLSYLSRRENLNKQLLGGAKLIIFEGISGTGKETQAKLLVRYLKKQGKEAEIIFHPSLRLKKTLKEWRRQKINSLSEALLFLADRNDVIRRELLPALKKGKWVIGLRNRLSTLVYQAKTAWEEDLINFLYSTFEPVPDLIFCFDLKPKIALSRVQKRFKKTGEEIGYFEKLERLVEHRKRYKKILKRFKKAVVIDASGARRIVHRRIIKILKERGLV